MNSNLHLNDLLLPIGAMNVISILPLLLLAPLMEFVTTWLLSVEKTPLAPAKVISKSATRSNNPHHLHLNASVLLSLPSSSEITPPLIPQPPFLITPPCPSSPSSSGSRLRRSVRPGGGCVGAAQEGVPPGGADPVWEGSLRVVHAVLPAGATVHPAGRG